ncbi:hypothetical protein RRG08_024421 [Elysia crispata]|uniref:Uncharacterized protein n=1 Tax=Elysia crispata TaxID=231223 RepID=A0AAE0YP25_9GAST|nr:hypothetical protein RRG08_024421 [Elysia crispata]
MQSPSSPTSHFLSSCNRNLHHGGGRESPYEANSEITIGRDEMKPVERDRVEDVGQAMALCALFVYPAARRTLAVFEV